MIRAITLFGLFFFMMMPPTVADTYPEVLFENSRLEGNYSYSNVYYSGLSWVENVDGKLPVSDSVFFTPGDALSLTYTSDSGHWRVQIAYPNAEGYRPQARELLTFKLFVASDTDQGALPKLAILQNDTLSSLVDIANYISDFQSNMWLNVAIPLQDFGGLNPARSISGLVMSQGRADRKVHSLYIDQIEFLPKNPPKVKLSSPAVLSAAKTYDRHVDLTWQLPLTPSIRYIKIYRSEDNKHFDPVAIRPIFVQKCTDFVPFADRKYYYKIAWVDYDYLESPFSDVLEAATQTTDDETFLNFIQAAEFNYFAERAEINSGMHAMHFGVDDATVSVKGTGLSILSHIVGVERGFISRSAAKSRLMRILDFLSKVERYHGAFPARIDGRTAKGVFAIDTVPEVDLESTAFLMQGLLTAQRYFQADSGETDSLGDKIGALWNDVAWDQFIQEDQGPVLYDRWSPTTGFEHARPLGGFGADFVCYLLAMASPSHPLHPEAYTKGLGIRRELADSTLEKKAGYVESPYTQDTTLYGLTISVGSLTRSLLEAYQPFLAFDPRGKRDEFADYFANHVNLTHIYRRRDNEQGVGGFSRDIWGLEPLVGIQDTLCLVNPAIACASYGYLPDEAIRSIRMFYDRYGNALFTEYGFRKGIAIDGNTLVDGYNELGQAAALVMIENGRSGLIWDLFTNHPDIQKIVRSHFKVE